MPFEQWTQKIRLNVPVCKDALALLEQKREHCLKLFAKETDANKKNQYFNRACQYRQEYRRFAGKLIEIQQRQFH